MKIIFLDSKFIYIYIFIFYYYNNWFIFSEEISRDLSHLLEKDNLQKEVEKNLAIENNNSMIFKLEPENQEKSIIKNTKNYSDENKFSTMFLLLILSILMNIGLVIYYIINHKTQSKGYLSQLQQLKDKNNNLDNNNCHLRQLNESLIDQNNALKKNNNPNQENSSLTSTENGNIVNKKDQSKFLNIERVYAELQHSPTKQEIEEFIDNLKLQIEKLQQDNYNIAEEKRILKDENQQLSNKNEELINFIHVNQDLKNLRDENQKLKYENDNLKEEKINMENINMKTLNILRDENQKLNEKIYNLYVELDKLEQQLQTFTTTKNNVI